jgi:glutamyl-tRNA synthetase
MSEKTRVRIAPSPTGEPHVGTAYTALFNYCFAKRHNGDFILRIEDTDQARSSSESEQAVFDALKWLGLEWNEGPDKDGEAGPYRQSERLDIYKKHVHQLIEKEAAYYCFCTSERLAEMRKKQMAEKQDPRYDGTCRHLDKNEAQQRARGGEQYVVRLKIPKENNETTAFYDEIRKKEIEYKNSDLDDQILLKADGFPTYHLANVVDDHLMEITHVIRAEEWIPSTPKHVLLYRAFGWDLPKFAHLSLLRNPDKSKVSKRRNPISLRWFRAAGYTPEAVINFLALLGYSTGKADERFTIDEVIKTISLDRLSTSAPVFDMVKLDILNEEYIRNYSGNEYIEYLKNTADFSAHYLSPLLPHIQKRHKIGQGFNFWTDMFFKTGAEFKIEDILTKDMDKNQAEQALRKTAKLLDKSGASTAEEIEILIKQVQEESGIKSKPFMMVLRVAITGSKTSLPLYESMAVLGREQCVVRLKKAASFVQANG